MVVPALADVLDSTADRSTSAYDVAATRGNDEVTSARAEFDGMRVHYADAVRAEMRRGGSRRLGKGRWDHTELAVEPLREAAAEAEAFPRPDQARGRALWTCFNRSGCRAYLFDGADAP